jgi:hypothetical protein
MNPQIETAWALHQFFASRGIRYAIIGGIAVQRWGQPRFTLDVDFTVLIPPGEERPLLKALVDTFAGRRADAVEFALRHRILLLHVPGAADADISLGLPGYEDELVARTVEHDLGDGRNVRLCSPEDLIIHKAVAGRPQDLLDLEGVILRQGRSLDVAYIRRWLHLFSDLMGDHEVLQRFEMLWSRLAED